MPISEIGVPTVEDCIVERSTIQTKRGAKNLAIDLQRRGFQAVPLHGDLSQNQRNRYMDAFRTGRAEILVATDIASRVSTSLSLLLFV